MTRAVVTYTIPADDPGRDKGKAFQITEMPAAQSEKWAIRALMALGKSGIELPDEVANGGMAAVAALGMRIFMRVEWDQVEPLLDEMFGCIRFIPSPDKPEVIRNLLADDIEEVMTRVKLRGEVWALHTGFRLGAEA